MTPLVLQLQQKAMDGNSDLLELLRMTSVIATKLDLEDLKQWVRDELNGYDLTVRPLPEYRMIPAQLKALNPYNGWIPVFCESRELTQKLTTAPITQSVSALAEIVASADGNELKIVLPSAVQMQLNRNTTAPIPMEHIQAVGRHQIVGVLDGIRNTMLEWSLRLEASGILGEGMTFSENEKSAAIAASQTIQNFYGPAGIVGDVHAENVQVGDYASVHAQLKDAGVSQSERNELENILDDLQSAESESKEPLLTRGLDWVARNAPSLGALSEIIRRWFQIP